MLIVDAKVTLAARIKLCTSLVQDVQATGLKERLNREKETNQDLVQQCNTAEQNVKGMEDEVRLVKRQLAIMAKARDVARQEKEDWRATCNRSAYVALKINDSLRLFRVVAANGAFQQLRQANVWSSRALTLSVKMQFFQYICHVSFAVFWRDMGCCAKTY